MPKALTGERWFQWCTTSSYLSRDWALLAAGMIATSVTQHNPTFMEWSFNELQKEATVSQEP